MNHPAIALQQLSVNYDSTPALWDISCTFSKGECIGIIGPNGAGKTTLLETLVGLKAPLSGKILFFGKPLQEVRKEIAYVPQRASVDWDFPITVRDLVLMGRYGKLGLFRWPRSADKKAAEHALDKVGMLDFSHRQIRQLSGGQQQRIFLARALLQEAEIYFLDEPFSGVDMATEAMIIQIFHKLCEEGKTLIVVHHDLNTVEKYYSSILLLNVRLIACGETTHTFTPQNIYTAYGKNYALLDEAFRLEKEKKAGRK